MTKLSDYTHIEVCKRALVDDNIYMNFKKIPEYTRILEHTSEYFGRGYLNLIFNKHKNNALLLNWEKLKENDRIGNSTLIPFLELKDYVKLDNYYYSPSTIYYIYRGLEVINEILSSGRNNILEIGGGYGGQCKLLLDMCKMLNINIEFYGIIDLEYASKLQNKYLSTFKYQNIEFFEFENIQNFQVFRKYNKVISMFALSEFEIDVQNYYIDNFIKHIDNYYILCNVHIQNDFFSSVKLIEALPDAGRYHKILIK